MKKLLSQVATYLPEERVAFIEAAYYFAENAHEGQRRLSGEPYITHPLETARFLADLDLDAVTVAAALLHDVIEDCNVLYSDLEREFGAEVADLVDGVTKLNRFDTMAADSNEVPYRRYGDDEHAANLRKMLVATAKDIRVVFIKLADRLHNMRTLQFHTAGRQIAIAEETLDIYAPLAHRLGMWDLKWRLEDMALRYLDPDRYTEISRLLSHRREERDRYIANVKDVLTEALLGQNIGAQVTGRAKNIYSIYQKMRAYAMDDKDFDDIHDLFALRVRVSEKRDCYLTLSVVHDLWPPLPGQVDDYIAKPKENMYQSLHTTVLGPDAVPLEVQIRTEEMHQLAEYGVAAHWRYKEGHLKDDLFERKMTWLRQLLEWQREVTGADEFLENVKTDILPDQVFVYTPKGDIKELPAGSTPIDFAYTVHTDLGHRCIGARINGKLVPLDSQIQNGDTVEIFSSTVDRGPSLEWLNPDAGYVRSATARSRIRNWFRRQEKGASIERGHDLLTRDLRRLNMSSSEEELKELFQLDSVDEFLMQLGNGDITLNQVIARLIAQEGRSYHEAYQQPKVGPASGIQVTGVGDLLHNMAKCCSPLPGDRIIGLINRIGGVTVHQRDCENLIVEGGVERVIPVDWGTTRALHPVRVSIDSWDRLGLLRDITSIVSGEKVNIASMVTGERDDGTATLQLTLYITGVDQLSRLFTKLEEVQGVINVARMPIEHTEYVDDNRQH